MHTQVRLPAVELDHKGFMRNPGTWDPMVAQELARNAGVRELTHAHWRVIETVQEYYARYGAPPPWRHVCEVLHLDRRCIDELFGYDRRAAWRIAGLPNPGEEAMSCV